MYVIKVIIEPGKIVYFRDTPFVFTSSIYNAYHFTNRNNAVNIVNDFSKVMSGYDLSIEKHILDDSKFVYHISDNLFAGV